MQSQCLYSAVSAQCLDLGGKRYVICSCLRGPSHVLACRAAYCALPNILAQRVACVPAGCRRLEDRQAVLSLGCLASWAGRCGYSSPWLGSGTGACQLPLHPQWSCLRLKFELHLLQTWNQEGKNKTLSLFLVLFLCMLHQVHVYSEPPCWH